MMRCGSANVFFILTVLYFIYPMNVREIIHCCVLTIVHYLLSALSEHVFEYISFVVVGLYFTSQLFVLDVINRVIPYSFVMQKVMHDYTSKLEVYTKILISFVFFIINYIYILSAFDISSFYFIPPQNPTVVLISAVSLGVRLDLMIEELYGTINGTIWHIIRVIYWFTIYADAALCASAMMTQISL